MAVFFLSVVVMSSFGLLEEIWKYMKMEQLAKPLSKGEVKEGNKRN
jgi:hypothetical protein